MLARLVYRTTSLPERQIKLAREALVCSKS